jgi:hypothetical protein
VTLDPAGPNTAELTASALSVTFPLPEPTVVPPAAVLAVEVGTITMDVAVYDVGRDRIRIVGSNVPTSTQAATIAGCRRMSHSTRRKSILCSGN